MTGNVRLGMPLVTARPMRAMRPRTWRTPFDKVALAGLVAWIVITTTYVVGGAQTVIAVAIAAFLADRLFGGRLPELGGSIGTWLLAYSAALVVTTPSSIWLGQSLGAIREQAKLLLIFFLIVGTASTDKRREWLLRLTIMLLVLYPARGTLQAEITGLVKVAGRANWRGLFGNANMLAAILALFLPFAIVWARTARGVARRFWWSGAAVVLTAAALSTQSRSGMLSLLVVFTWVLAAARNRVRALGLVTVVLVGAVVMSPTSVGDRLWSMTYVVTGDRPPEEHQADVGNAESRLLIWRAALDIVADNPVLGVGPGAFEEAHRHYQRYVEWDAGALWIDAHNSFLRVWSETGTVGLIAFLGIFVAVFREGRRGILELRRVGLGRSYEGQMVSAALAGLAAFLVSNFFNTFKDAWYLYLHLAFCVLLIARAGRAAGAAAPMRPTTSTTRRAVGRVASPPVQTR